MVNGLESKRVKLRVSHKKANLSHYLGKRCGAPVIVLNDWFVSIDFIDEVN
jgi:hypothetical protein